MVEGQLGQDHFFWSGCTWKTAVKTLTQRTCRVAMATAVCIHMGWWKPLEDIIVGLYSRNGLCLLGTVCCLSTSSVYPLCSQLFVALQQSKNETVSAYNIGVRLFLYPRSWASTVEWTLGGMSPTCWTGGRQHDKTIYSMKCVVSFRVFLRPGSPQCTYFYH